MQYVYKSVEAGYLDQNTIDVDSFVYRQLTDEYFKNIDGQIKSSFYYYNPIDKKIYAGPVWDYDNSMGFRDKPSNNGNRYGSEPEGLFCLYSPGYYSMLYSIDSYYNRLIEIYKTSFRKEVNSTIGAIDGYSSFIIASTKMDAKLWGTDHQDFINEINRIKTWLVLRRNYLDVLWLSNKTIIVKNYANGELLEEVQTQCGKLVNCPDIGNVEWKYNRNGNWEYSIHNSIIAEPHDMELYSVWEYEWHEKPIQNIAFNTGCVNLDIGEQYILDLYYNPADTSDSRDVDCIVGDNDIIDAKVQSLSVSSATATKILVSAKNEGTTTITADCNGISSSSIVVLCQ